MATNEWLYKLLYVGRYGYNLSAEAREQYRFVCFCRSMSIQRQLKAVWHSVPNEISGNTRPIFGKKLAALGKIAGAPDLVFMWDTGSLGMEFKSDTGSLEDSQKLFKQWCESLNVPYCLVRSCEEGIETLQKFNLLV